MTSLLILTGVINYIANVIFGYKGMLLILEDGILSYFTYSFVSKKCMLVIYAAVFKMSNVENLY